MQPTYDSFARRSRVVRQSSILRVTIKTKSTLEKSGFSLARLSFNRCITYRSRTDRGPSDARRARRRHQSSAKHLVRVSGVLTRRARVVGDDSDGFLDRSIEPEVGGSVALYAYTV